MRTTTPSRSGSRRLVLAGLLSLPIAALLMAAPASAASGPAETKKDSSSSAERGRDAAPGQEKKAEAAPQATQESAPQQQSAPQEQAAPQQSAPAKADNGSSSGKAATKGSSNGTSGTQTEPQPLSNADKNGTGANPGPSEPCPHAYCSTRDGSASKNGNGGGEASGKPCAGCVGKADNKNPPGQAPDGSDGNNGYECDGNNGIGKTNPAHTGCRTATPPPPPSCPAGTPVGGTMSNGCKPPTCPAGTPVGGTMANGCKVETCPAGTPVGGTMSNGCKPPTCPAGTPVGGTMANGCKVETCPAGTPVGGTMANGCKVETCPAGTPVGGTMSNGCKVETCPAGSPVGATMADGCSVPLTPPTTVRTSTLPVDVLSATTVRPGQNPLVVPLASASPQLVAGPAVLSTAKAAAPQQVRPTVLPFTGVSLVWLLPSALVALALGLALVAAGRSRRTVTA